MPSTAHIAHIACGQFTVMDTNGVCHCPGCLPRIWGPGFPDHDLDTTDEQKRAGQAQAMERPCTTCKTKPAEPDRSQCHDCDRTWALAGL
jgi:hypothetical protein